MWSTPEHRIVPPDSRLEVLRVRMGNEGACRIVGIGDVRLTMSTRCRLLLKEVRHVPEVRLNLMSAGWLDDEGYEGSIPNGIM